MRKALPGALSGTLTLLLLAMMAWSPSPVGPPSAMAQSAGDPGAAQLPRYAINLAPPPWLMPSDGVHAPGPDDMDIKWLGVAGFEIRTAKATLLFDPYFSRTPLWDLISKSALPNLERVHRGLQHRAQAVFVSHSHFDHFMDAPEVARELNCPLYVSDQGERIAAAAGLPAAQRKTVAAKDVIHIGDMDIEVVESEHSDMPTQLLAGGNNPPTAHWPMWFLEFHNGPTFGYAIHWRGRTIYHNASAQIVDSAIGHRSVDVALMCLTGWTSTPHIWEREYAALHPRVMIPMHDDDFFQPIERGWVENPLAQRARGLGAIHQAMPQSSVVTMDFLQTLRVHAATGQAAR